MHWPISMWSDKCFVALSRAIGRCFKAKDRDRQIELIIRFTTRRIASGFVDRIVDNRAGPFSDYTYWKWGN